MLLVSDMMVIGLVVPIVRCRRAGEASVAGWGTWERSGVGLPGVDSSIELKAATSSWRRRRTTRRTAW